MSITAQLINDATDTGNLGNLPLRGSPRVTYIPQDGVPGGFCRVNGKPGKLRKVNGRYQCVPDRETDEAHLSEDPMIAGSGTRLKGAGKVGSLSTSLGGANLGFAGSGSEVTCMKNGKIGTYQIIDGRKVCVLYGETEAMTDRSTLGEAKGLRFTSSSRTQIGKQYAIFDVHMRAVQGTGNLTISTIQGNPGNWFFTVTSPGENQRLDTAKLNGKLVAGVNVTAVNESMETIAPAKPKSVSERLAEMVEQAKQMLGA